MIESCGRKSLYDSTVMEGDRNTAELWKAIEANCEDIESEKKPRD